MTSFAYLESSINWLTLAVSSCVVTICAFKLRRSSRFGSILEDVVNLVALSLWTVVTTLFYNRLFQSY